MSSHLIEKGIKAVYPLLELAEAVVSALALQGERVDNLPFGDRDWGKTSMTSEGRKRERVREPQDSLADSNGRGCRSKRNTTSIALIVGQ